MTNLLFNKKGSVISLYSGIIIFIALGLIFLGYLGGINSLIAYFIGGLFLIVGIIGFIFDKFTRTMDRAILGI